MVPSHTLTRVLATMTLMLALSAPAVAQTPFGVRAQFSPMDGAMVIAQVAPGSLAATHGVRAGDYVVGGIDTNGRRVDIGQGGERAFAALVRGAKFTLFVYRPGQTHEQPLRIRVTRRTGGASSGDAPAGGTAEPGSLAILRDAAKRHAEKPVALRLRREQFKDQNFGGMVSHRMLVPKDWRVRGASVWTPTETITNHFIAKIDGEDGRQIRFDRARNFTYSQDPMYLQVLRSKGQAAMANNIAPPQQLGEAAVTVLMRVMRPSARDVRLEQAGRDEQSERMFAKLSPIPAGLNSRRTVEAALVSYTENGKRYEEFFWYIQNVTRLNDVVGQAPMFMWGLLAPRSYRAPAGELVDCLAMMFQVASSLRETPRWSICRTKLLQEIARIRHRGAMERSRIMAESAQRIARTNNEISDSQMASWRRQQSMRDGGHKRTINGIAEVHDYRTRDGLTVPLDHGYDRVFEDRLGNIILTNDANFDPSTDPSMRTNDWVQLRRER